ncbi:loganic acid O-methyltransferase-like [Rosa rugosa]|uniref:loganic acid O-methyltransferase-like n=1 Tax=Rosa rugosa TaxID=74645 RepID=UPI002B406CED|nr:loganic acid O-methyltransferase-like [Rosa rugosa]XP_062002783.1 loganic acid O-methyltransferase-like [Rosa rugosa]XP_062002784.1 loganic acid O-methyltransferase-like [Rosa rugosa]XP_062002785.1 loganic acid O-methyltransferase-like [Rosa rugosa]XP_062002787.1 loganic acid O-methyltransferase-like [Rosa rugosa]XP_062002788.1 loganic acid O-methyltransferase-like [Rosa rugosa]XP_062002789.1 loganic acid O-methyltransferase-like [Rosa rugosa]XP_062002790.1 loganic acid O-methyltransferas
MAAEETGKCSEAYPMKGGDGPSNYAKNSIYQKGVIDAAKELLNKAIAEKLDIETFSSANSFHIADLGCSVGPNTFLAVENILEAVLFKYQSRGLNCQIPEFQVFFNDHTSNDFNMLFNSLPQNRQYYAAGLPGSFYGRILPDASIHFFHSSISLHWLSRVPKDVTDSNSLAWNKGRIHYLDSTDEVVRAYEAQYAEDMECFLHARAQETVHGGLMVITTHGYPADTPPAHSRANIIYQILGSCLIDMTRKGVVSEEKIDSFNVPIYYVCPQELEAAVERNGCFSIDIMEHLPTVMEQDTISKNSKLIASHTRAVMEGLFKQHFGEEILDELFDLFHKKVEEQHSAFESGKVVDILIVLKRKAN